MDALSPSQLRSAADFVCRFCGKRVNSAQGLRAHITARHAAEAAAAAQERPLDPHLDALLGGPEHDPGATGEVPGPSYEQDASPPASPPASIGQRGRSADRHSDVESKTSTPASEPGGYVLEQFPGPVATVLNDEPQPLPFETRLREQQARGESPYAPFADADEWEFAHWIAKSGLSHGEMDKLLKLRKTQGMNVSFKNSREYFKRIDGLPHRRGWQLKRIKLRGDILDAHGKPLVEKLELWFRNVVDIIIDLLANPAFADCTAFEPVRVWLNKEKTKRVYSEAYTGNWWWELQKRLPEGALIIPIIVASDKTQLSTFSGDKSAYPVYISIGNIRSDVRRQPSARATVLLGYLPVSKFEVYATAEARSAAAHRLFHACMAEMLAPLVAAGSDGLNVLCNDGNIRRAFMVLMSYVADYPEQCLVACGQQNQCPSCFVPPTERGAAPSTWAPRTESAILEVLEQGPSHPDYKVYGLKDVAVPFWAQLPHSDIFRCFTPDMLHELHKGAFGDHVLKWCVSILGQDEFDRRLRCLPRHPSLRHFHRGISVISQWRGAEYREIEKVFVGLTAGHSKPALGAAARALLDFIYCARMAEHDDDTLAFMDGALARFHEHKKIFVDLGIRKHFNISKIHKLIHYVSQIRAYGAAPGYNTESPERLHIDLCKEAYRASNKKDFIAQMTLWLDHDEAVDEQTAYIAFCFPPPRLRVPFDSMGDDSDSDAEDQEEMHASDDDNIIVHSLPVHPSFHRQTIEQIDARHGVPQFLPCLNAFLSTLPSSVPAARATDVFDIYKRVVVVENVNGAPSRDLIRATPAYQTTRDKTTGPFFDTALIGRDGKFTALSSCKLTDLDAVQVKVIFELPSRFKYDAPLAFVEHFTRFRGPSKDVGLLWTSPARQGGQRRCSVVRLDSIVGSCHLLPKFPAITPDSWSTDTIFEVCNVFHPNEFLNDRLFGIDQ